MTVSYLLDTNVVSETRKRRAAPELVQLLASLPASRTYLSVLTIGEMRRGVVLKQKSDPELAADFVDWLTTTERQYAKRVLPVTAQIADQWGRLSADRTRPIIDTLLAATALVHDLTVVTRNERDFADLGVRLINPWR